jgi:alkylation response protein AidB-like acyl-CoA dehydrogenase
MRLELDSHQARLVAETDRAIDDAGVDVDPRECFARLGAERLLAVHYPTSYGGRGLSLAHHFAIAERLGERGLPDEVHLITVQGVGCAILTYGTRLQRDRWLPGIAGGRLFASLLLSEVAAGSDLAGIETTAATAGDGWRISGTKVWSLQTDWSRLALCSARTRTAEHRYDGISLFLIDLTSPGVEITPTPRAAGAPYFSVTLDGVRVGADALLGPPHKGWFLLPTVIGFERAGFDYLTRAKSWLRAASQEAGRLPAGIQAALASDLVGLQCAVENVRALAFHAANSAADLQMDEMVTAYSKLACGRVAQAVARWAGQNLLTVPGPDSTARAILRAAVAEAPELTVSGGAQELQLDLIATECPIGGIMR